MKSANDLRSLNAEIAKLKERLSASVPRTELLSSQRTATALHDENISLKTSLGNLRASLQDQVHIVRAEIMEMNDFIQEASGMVPESVYAALHVKMQRVARELQDLQDEKLRLQADLSDVRSQRDVLKTAVEDLERQIQEMVGVFALKTLFAALLAALLLCCVGCLRALTWTIASRVVTLCRLS
jgi:chromosome segregation ATPase